MMSRRVDVGDLTLAVTEAGTGGVPLLLLHGFTGAKEDFGDWIDAFAASGWHVVAPDLRGHGASDHPTGEAAYSLDVLASDALALADALGWTRFALLGHSMGGMVAQVLTLRAPERVERLVLMDTSHGPVQGVDPELLQLAIVIVRREGIDGLAEAMTQYEAPLSSAADARVRAERPGYVEWSDGKLRSSSPAMYAAMAIEMFEQHDRLDALGSLRMPVLVVVGEQDVAFLPAAHRMAEAIPAARLEVVADAGHSPQFEAPDAWWSAVATFLEPGLA